ncbi:MAG: PAS domain S-box protein [Chloroflexi bacterium]|nr:PAS domain S-box protein [Chloroflexota bacterium]
MALKASIRKTSQKSIKVARKTTSRKRSADIGILFENHPVPMWVYDLKSLAFLEVNDAAVEKYGYSRAEFKQMTIKDIRPEEDVHRLMADVERERPALQHSGEWRHRLKDGRVIDVEITSHTLKHKGRDAVLVMAQDITERKMTETALRDSESRLAGVIASAMDAIISIDSEQRIVMFNAAAEDMFRCPAGKAIGRPLEHFIPGRFRTAHRTHIKAFSETGITSRSMGELKPLSALRTDGEEFPIEASISQVIVSGQKILTAILRDVSERKRDEEALYKSEERYRSTLETMLEGAQIIGSDWRYLYLNDAAAQQGRQPKENLIGHTMMEVYPGIENTALFTALQRCIKEQTSQQMDNEFIYPDGDRRWFKLSIHSVPEGIFILSMDITDRKNAETEILKLNMELEKRVAKRTAQLEAANKELEAFSYSVSHDLRAPLRAIDGFSLALLEDYASQLPAEAQNYLQRVRASAQRMAELIDDMLNLSRVTRTPLERQPVNLSEMAGRICTELKQNHPERQVTFTITPSLIANGDPHLIEVLLENLLGNAWKFTSKREQAHIEFGALPHPSFTSPAGDSTGTLREGDGGEGKTFFVRDNGAGFDMTYAGKLFGAFQRLHSLSEFPGTGIGLATVQRIINRHGGKIWAEGKVNEGATFYFTFSDRR